MQPHMPQHCQGLLSTGLRNIASILRQTVPNVKLISSWTRIWTLKHVKPVVHCCWSSMRWQSVIWVFFFEVSYRFVCVKQLLYNDFQRETYKMYDTIPYCFWWLIEVSHHTFYSSHDESPFVETVFKHTNVCDDTSDYRLYRMMSMALWFVGCPCPAYCEQWTIPLILYLIVWPYLNWICYLNKLDNLSYLGSGLSRISIEREDRTFGDFLPRFLGKFRPI